MQYSYLFFLVRDLIFRSNRFGHLYRSPLLHFHWAIFNLILQIRYSLLTYLPGWLAGVVYIGVYTFFGRGFADGIQSMARRSWKGYGFCSSDGRDSTCIVQISQRWRRIKLYVYTQRSRRNTYYQATSFRTCSHIQSLIVVTTHRSSRAEVRKKMQAVDC